MFLSEENAPCNLLDPATIEFLDTFSKTFASIAHFPIPEQRATIKEMFRVPENLLESVAMTEDKMISGKNGSINIRLFSPENEGPLPVIVYFHRGGWVYGSIEESEMICRRLANETRSIVAAVEYRLSPEDKFPIPLEDCYDTTKWIIENASTFKVSGNPQKVILCGESGRREPSALSSLNLWVGLARKLPRLSDRKSPHIDQY